ncbi:YrdB family protein [Rossellomorea arthrocnemi]|uniref:YrdB family protein n=1 Tax=Rossellomorea arthrocnemi TaxID=2769542 RepID=UPI001918CE81|nr:YrdB family protein [Rossellomorea arthrocnemi]
MEIKWIGVSVLTGFFLLELGAIAAFSYWGYHIHSGAAVKIILAVATPLVIATLWSKFLSPKASLPIFSFPTRTTLKLVVFIVASIALYASGLSAIAVTFLTVSLLLVAAVFILKLHKVNM